jgi:hypothetical protein
MSIGSSLAVMAAPLGAYATVRSSFYWCGLGYAPVMWLDFDLLTLNGKAERCGY